MNITKTKIYRKILNEMFPVFQSFNTGKWGYRTVHGCADLNSAIFKSEQAAKFHRGKDDSVYWDVCCAICDTLLKEINSRFDVGTNTLCHMDDYCCQFISDDQEQWVFYTISPCTEAIILASKVRTNKKAVIAEGESLESLALNEIYAIFTKYEKEF